MAYEFFQLHQVVQEDLVVSLPILMQTARDHISRHTRTFHISDGVDGAQLCPETIENFGELGRGTR